MARPQKLTDDQLLIVIGELRRANPRATGVEVRRELSRRFHVRAGTDRIYRVLKAWPSTLPSSPAASADLEQLIIERDTALRRAELAEMREEATQERTAMEIDSLRQRLRELGVDPFDRDGFRDSRPFRV